MATLEYKIDKGKINNKNEVVLWFIHNIHMLTVISRLVL